MQKDQNSIPQLSMSRDTLREHVKKTYIVSRREGENWLKGVSPSFLNVHHFSFLIVWFVYIIINTYLGHVILLYVCFKIIQSFIKIQIEISDRNASVDHIPSVFWNTFREKVNVQTIIWY